MISKRDLRDPNFWGLMLVAVGSGAGLGLLLRELAGR